MGELTRSVEMSKRLALSVAAFVALATGGCGAMKKTPPPVTPAPEAIVIPTVPARTPTPVGATPLPTRPVENPATEKKALEEGKAIGPVITYAGISRADGREVGPDAKKKNGIPVFVNHVGSGFMITLEGKPGISNLEVGRRIFVYDENDPTQRPDVEIEVDRKLGDGSARVCDQRRPFIGGIPAINPPSFAETKHVAAALNDFSCRFETFIESASACTVNKYGDFAFRNKESTTQFCMVVAKAWNFPKGDTLVSVRLRDSNGNPGPVARFYLRRSQVPRPKYSPHPTPAPTPVRRRP
jgi:hypothetical protein